MKLDRETLLAALAASGRALDLQAADEIRTLSKMDHPAVGKRCIVRTYASGVHLGTVTHVENGGQFSRCVLKNARRIRYWYGARSLSEVAIDGIATAKSQVHANIPEHFVEDAIEFIPATDLAIASIEAATNEAK
jgi:hypothetical protein